jgi:membrane protease YdiL (CAAX protease family)
MRAPPAADMSGPVPTPGLARLARVLWRLGSFAVAWVLAQGIFESLAGPAFGALSRTLGEPVPMYPFSMLAGVLGGCWAGIRFMDVAPWSVLGIGEGTWHPRQLALGAAMGTAAIAFTMALLWVAQQVRFEAVPALAFVGDTWTGTALRLLLVLGPAALWEELAFRGYLYAVAAEAGNRLLARSTTSVAFGLVHLMNPGAGLRTTLIVMLAGWCLCLVRERVGLPGAWTAHLAWNWVMAAVLHVPVSGLPFATPGYRAVVDGPEWLSGGSWGPEGGLVAALVLTVAAGLSERRGRWPRPGQASTHVS